MEKCVSFCQMHTLYLYLSNRILYRNYTEKISGKNRFLTDICYVW